MNAHPVEVAVEPVDAGGSRARFQKAKQTANQRRFSGTIGAQQAEDFTFANAEANPIECEEIAITLA